MSQGLPAYLPQDRRDALARGEALPERASGAVLFADLSGFTPLAERLALALGQRAGAEALSAALDAVYTALIAHVDRLRGSVISFAGDAITCWFDDRDGPAASRAAACALAMQQAMAAFGALPLPGGETAPIGLKVAVATGPVRRFVVGGTGVPLQDAIAGATVERVAAVEQLARRGDALIDEATVAALGSTARLGAWRGAQDGAAVRAAPLLGLDAEVAVEAWPEHRLDRAALLPWLLPAVAERESLGLGAFVTAFRPVVAMFVRFSGVDYEADDALPRLAAFVDGVADALGRHEGTLLQLTIGDKGSFLYAGFGALLAHEDDARRALLAALAIRDRAETTHGELLLQIGLSSGMLRAGAYGAPGRRTYGALGDDVNLAARLMGQAAPGEILISGRVRNSLGGEFALEPRPPLALKGKAEPLPVFAVQGLSRRRAIRLEEPSYQLPLVGRDAERARVAAAIAAALAGRGQVVGLIAEAGMGKSRLVAETLRQAGRRGMTAYGGTCQSFGADTPYLVWKPIWQAFFNLDPAAPPRRQLRALEGLLEEWAPERLEALPLLAPLLGLAVPESALTAALEPQFRKSALHALLLASVRAAAGEAAERSGGLLFVLEDLHWVDALSHELLVELAHAIAELPVLLLLAYRPPELQRLQAPQVEGLPHFTRVELGLLGPADAEQLIRAKLAQLLPERAGAVPPALVERIATRAQGNPFYLEELLNYLHDRGIQLGDDAALDALELPASLHSLVLSRIDQLATRQQVVLQMASVIGRRFRYAWLREAYPAFGEPEALRADLDELARLELTPLDTPEPELAYLFKHIVTLDVAYAALAAALRAELHAQFAAYLELQAGDESDAVVDVLAFHYERSGELGKARHYLRRAGELAAARYANQAALEYLGRALALTPPDDRAARAALLLAREPIYGLLAEREAQARDLDALAQLAHGDPRLRLQLLLRRAIFAIQTGDSAAATAALDELIAQATAQGDRASLGQAHRQLGTIATRRGDYAAAEDHLAQALAIARSRGDRKLESSCLNTLGIVAWYRGELATARDQLEQALAIERALGNRVTESYQLGNLGLVASNEGAYGVARDYHEQSLRISRAVGDRAAEGRTLNNLGEVALELGDFAYAVEQFLQASASARATGSRHSEALALSNIAVARLLQGELAPSRADGERALALARELSFRPIEQAASLSIGRALLAGGAPDKAAPLFDQALAIARELGNAGRVIEALEALLLLALAQGDRSATRAHAEALLTSDGLDRSPSALLACHQALAAVGDDRAAELLARAHAALLARASKLDAEADRQRMLAAFPAHRAILAAWAARPQE